MLESNFQSKLIKDLKTIFPGCVILKNDANYKKDIPDLTVLYKDHWAMLECKRSRQAMLHCAYETQKNQKWWVDTLNQMSFASYIYPENKSQVIDELKRRWVSDEV